MEKREEEASKCYILVGFDCRRRLEELWESRVGQGGRRRLLTMLSSVVRIRSWVGEFASSSGCLSLNPTSARQLWATVCGGFLVTLSLCGSVTG